MLVYRRSIMKYINIADYQGCGFAVGRIWNNKKELIEQVLAWENVDFIEDEKENEKTLKKMKTQQIVDYMNEVWEIEVVRYSTLTQEEKREYKEYE